MEVVTVIQVVLQVFGLVAIGSVILDVVEIPQVKIVVKNQNIFRWTYIRACHKVLSIKRRFQKEPELAKVIDLSEYRARKAPVAALEDSSTSRERTV